jgi:hypothetical protein
MRTTLAWSDGDGFSLDPSLALGAGEDAMSAFCPRRNPDHDPTGFF